MAVPPQSMLYEWLRAAAIDSKRFSNDQTGEVKWRSVALTAGEEGVGGEIRRWIGENWRWNGEKEK